MEIHNLHSWQVDVAQAKQIQLRLSHSVVSKSQEINPHFVAGVDISSSDSKGIARGAAVILSYPDLKLIEVKIAEARLNFPYIPGLLSFRECPLTLEACQKICNTPDLVLVDGQGVAHPRRFGLASHLGVFLDIPTIGCAKSILCGKHEPVGKEAGSHAELIDSGEVVGAALRTRLGATPIYVSIGHKIDLASALYWVTNCCRGHRIPEPTRWAHLAASGKLMACGPSYPARLFN